FLNFRCFHYRDPNTGSDGRLESGEDVDRGLQARVNQADIIVYLLEEQFAKSEYCAKEVEEGVALRKRGQIELRAYCLDGLKDFPKGLENTSLYSFRDLDWNDSAVEQKIVKDIEASSEAIGWALRADSRATLTQWLKQDGRYTIDAVFGLLN